MLLLVNLCWVNAYITSLYRSVIVWSVVKPGVVEMEVETEILMCVLKRLLENFHHAALMLDWICRI